MAIAGGTTGAYTVKVQGFFLDVQPRGAYPSAECTKIDDALARLERGEAVIVAGGDVETLKRRLREYGVSA